MKNVIGFTAVHETDTTPEYIDEKNTESRPVKSIVSVRFAGCSLSLKYYNDLFDIHIGDIVYVSGKYAGKPGIVEDVTTKFKINLADYEKVLARPEIQIHGEYEALFDKMYSDSPEAPTADMFRSWVIPPLGKDEEEPEIVSGEGHTIELDNISDCEDFSDVIAERAVNYCNEGKVLFTEINDEIGTSFVDGTRCYEVNFKIDNDVIYDLFCDCPYAGLCKHELAAVLTVRAVRERLGRESKKRFVAIDRDFFWRNVNRTTEYIKL